jgi:alpha-mannosidase
MVAPKYTRQTQFGVLDLPIEKALQESFKIPSLSWINGQEGNRGLAFITQGVPINEIKGGEIYCTLLRSVSVLSADGVSGPLIPTPDAQELGEHTYHYSVYPHDGDWRKAQIHRRGFETSQPLSSFQLDRKPSAEEYRGITLGPVNLVLSALKKAEDDDSLIIRFFETCGEACTARLTLPEGIGSVKSVNLLEQEEEALVIRRGKVEMKVAPFEIVTLKLGRS